MQIYQSSSQSGMINLSFRNFLRFFGIILVALALSGCGGLGSFSAGDLFGSGEAPQEASSQAPDVNAITNAGGVKVAFLLPLGVKGEAGNVARSLKEAGEMALVESGSPGITLLTKDTVGTPAGAAAAARAAISEGAELIIGPLFAGSVQAVAPVARSKNVPVIAFSSVSSVAGNGVYLMSFLPEEEVANIVRYSAGKGRKRILALVPKTAYGGLIERALATELQRRGGSLIGVHRYSRTSQGVIVPAKGAVQTLANASNPADTLLIAEGGDMLRMVSSALSNAGLRRNMVKIVGTGKWDEPITSSIALLQGGWYPGVSPDQTTAFKQRFSKTYGRAPQRIASLAYDAVSLAIALARKPAGNRYTPQNLTNSQGFQGSNGLFRFTSQGRNQRGLAILEVTSNGPRVIGPPPGSFSAGY
jgi:branched-chain amino acid transport system substrate-binding protein